MTYGQSLGQATRWDIGFPHEMKLLRNLECVGAEQDEIEAPLRGVVGRASSASLFDLNRWAPSIAAGRFVEHFWSVSWDLRDQEPFDSTVITFPSLHITHEWGSDGPRHGLSLPNTLVHGVVERVFRTTISEHGAVVGARFRPGGFTARFQPGRRRADGADRARRRRIIRRINTSRGRCRVGGSRTGRRDSRIRRRSRPHVHITGHTRRPDA